MVSAVEVQLQLLVSKLAERIPTQPVHTRTDHRTSGLAQASMITVGRQVRRESENTLVASGVSLLMWISQSHIPYFQVAIPETISMAEKKSPCTLSAIGEQAHLTTNMWLLSANDVTVYKYDVDFKGIQTLDDGQTRVVSFTKRSSDRYVPSRYAAIR